MEKDVLNSLEDKGIFEILRAIWVNNFARDGFEGLAIEVFEKLEKVNNFDEVKEVLDKTLQNKDFKKNNRKVRKSGNLNEFSFRLLEEDLQQAKSYLDYGCGRMALIRRIVKEDLKNLEVIYGFEPKAQIDYLDFDKRVKLLRTKSEVEKLENLDLITINYVLHHLTSEEIREALGICKNVLAKNGKIIVLEESYLGEEVKVEGELAKIFASQKFSHTPHLNQLFEALPIETKKAIIFTNDVLINYKNLSYMPWTMEYHSIGEWRSIFEESGLKIEQIQHLGFVKGVKLKGGTTTVFELKIKDKA